MNKLIYFKFLAVLLTTLWGIQQASAYDFYMDGIYYSLGSGTLVSVANNGSPNTYSGDVTIPATVTYNGTTYTVASIGYQAFMNCTGLTSVKLPEGIVYLMNNAFSGCSSLTSITLPSTVSTIYNNVFIGCTSLQDVTCMRSSASSTNVNNFDASTYQNATLHVPMGSLSSYQSTAPWSSFATIEESTKFSVNNIYYQINGSGTVEVTYKDTNFNYYSGHVTIPSTVTYGGVTYTVVGIGRSAFRSSPDLTSVSIPGSVTYIDYGAFYQCTGLTQMSIPNSVVTFGEFCFMGCSNLSVFNMSNSGVTAIPRQCFTSCTGLQSISFPGALKDISYFAFYYCSSLGTVSLPQGLESIQYAAFEGCSSLTSVTIPSSVTYIGGGAFSDCNSMVSYDVNSMNQHYKSVDGVLFDIAMDTLLLYPNMHAQLYEIPSSVKVIGDLAFSGCNNVTSVTLLWGVRYIGSSAFASCTNLEAIEIPTSVEHIGASAFTYCQKLETIKIPAGVTYIGDNALTFCTSLQAIEVEEGNRCYKSDYGVLYTMDGHMLIQYPCARPDKHYSVLNTTDTIGQSAFSYSKVKSIYLPKSLRSLGYQPFVSSEVERVVIDEGLETIPYNAFYDCEQMKSIYLPSTIKEIGNQAFTYTLKLEQLTIAVDGEAPTIGSNAFYGMGYDTPNGRTTVYVPNGMATKYDNTDDWLNSMSEFTDIVPIALETEFTVDSLNMVTTDSQLNVKVTGVTAKTLLDPGIPPKVAVNGNLCTVTTLGYTSLQHCTRMVRAEVPFTVTWMDDYSFYGCTNIQELRLRDGVKQIDPFSVSHINAMTTLTIPASVDSISGTFVNYSYGLKEIAVDKDNAKYTSVNGVLFSRGRKRLVAYPYAHGTEYIVPQGTEVIASSSFRGSALTQVTLPTTLRTIEGTAFFDDQSLTSVVVPRGVVTIGNSAFGSCTAMTSAELPETLTSLGYNAFYNVPHLTSLTVKNPTPPTCVIYTNPHTHTVSIPFMDIHFTQCTLYVPRGSKAAYQAANIWKNFTNIVEIDLPVEAKRGDVNGDGQVAISDVTALIDYLLGGGNIAVDAADVNIDGNVTISDVTALIDYLLGGQWPATGRLDLWYLIGDNVGSQPWENNGQNSVGRGLLPLYPVGEFDSNGKGQLQYTGYFGANEAVMLIHNPGRFDDCWGYKPTGVFGFGGEDITAVSTGNDGYYSIMLYNNPDRFFFIPYTASTPISFNSINIVGPHSSWDVTNSEYNMTPLNPGKENHNWIFRDFTTASDTEIKIAANNWWDYNWGVEQFPWGRGERNGNNIPVEAGTYDVYFNDITGDFHFIKK